MVHKLKQEFRKFYGNCCFLRRVLRETHESLDAITAAKIFRHNEVNGNLSKSPVLQKLDGIINGHPALVVLGQNCQAKAKLVNALLEQEVLPTCGGAWRWVRIVHGATNHISLTLGPDFELVEKLECHTKPWQTVPEQDLKRPESEMHLLESTTVLEVELCNPTLGDNFQLLIPPDGDSLDAVQLQELMEKGLEDVVPIFLYAISESTLVQQNLDELHVLKELHPKCPVYFVHTASGAAAAAASDLTESGQHRVQATAGTNAQLQPLSEQLTSLGYIANEKPMSVLDSRLSERFPIASELNASLDNPECLIAFIRGCLQAEVVAASVLLNELLGQLLRLFILSAFDMAREIQITPRRIHYALAKEGELFRSLVGVASDKQEEVAQLVRDAVRDMRAGLVETAGDYSYRAAGTEPPTARLATAEIQQLVLGQLSNAVAVQLVKSVDCLQDTFIGTLQRCLESLERQGNDGPESTNGSSASDAFKQILSAAYNVELTSCATSSMLHSFLERLRSLIHSVQLPWGATPRLDSQWRRRVASEMLDSLSAARLARSISAQFRDRVRSSHEAFLSALRSLECHYSGRLEQTEEQRVAIRKHHAPRLARLSLETTSMCDKVRYGMPQLGKEIGRGQYGVVFACDSWGGAGPCAVKTVVPPDDRHWNDLAMEFYYTRTIAEHKRIVRLRGSVVDYLYGAESTPAVLLVMDRLARDLYCGLRAGLPWMTRLQVAVDVVEGIRFLHSQGLVHRDIKLKNVLLDSENRAKLTDLGFCIPEAMMSGSVVGTPVHMAPELLSGHYDSSVDVYAFGILFWYICAGHVKLPYIFEHFQNKEQLWTSVKKGIRPERLPIFDTECWQLMEQCWSGEPSKRPLLGYVLPLLESIRTRYADSGHTSNTDVED